MSIIEKFDRYLKGLISFIVLAILITQFFVNLIDTGRWGWPFITYPMYANSHQEGERVIYDVKAFAVYEDLTRNEIKRSELGMNIFLFQKHVWYPIENADIVSLQPLINRYCESTDNKLIRFELEDLGVAVSRNGPVSVEPQIISSLDVSC